MNDASRLPLQTIRPDHYEVIKANTHILYRCFNKRGVLLYIGMTSRPEQRFQQHRDTKIWWKYVDHITMQRYNNRSALMHAETEAIYEEHPKFNVVNPGVPTRVTRRRSVPLWSEPSTFGIVQPDDAEIDPGCLERQLFPCLQCQSRSLYLEADPDTVVCDLCSAEWAYKEWFALNFPSSVA